MTKILHLISDEKFVDIHIQRFEDSRFYNRYVFIGAKTTYLGKHQDKLDYITWTPDLLRQLVAEADSYDLVFIYNLDYNKALLVERVSARPIVIWHLYGTEIYNNYNFFKYSIYSNKTRKALGIGRGYILIDSLRLLASRIKHRLLNKKATYDVIKRAIRRVNFLAWYSKEEYDLLQKGTNFQLPPFLSLSVVVQDAEVRISTQEKRKIICLGNSASPENNHLDILDVLKKQSYKGEIFIPFSYSFNKKYVSAITKNISDEFLNVIISNEFLQYYQYVETIQTFGTAVFNSYRQLALGNIFLFLKAGSKIYLSERNPSYQWLLACNFLIFSIEKDLERDIVKDNLLLDPDAMIANKVAYERLVSWENNQLFLNKVLDIVAKRDQFVGS